LCFKYDHQQIYVCFCPSFFDERIQVRYSKTELVDNIDDIKHPIVREIVRRFAVRGIDINAIADIPAGTGLGSSGAFTVGLLNAFYAYCGKKTSKEKLGREACQIEIDILREPIGKQDQYAAAYGGLNFITFHTDDRVTVEPLRIPEDRCHAFENQLLFFYLGGSRPARDILSHQQERMKSDKKIFSKIKRMTELTRYLRTDLLAGNLLEIGEILEESWFLKKELSPMISSDTIDYYYNLARRNGASGGKLLGAGGAGFLMLYCEIRNQKN